MPPARSLCFRGSATDGKKTVFLQNANFAFENVTLVK